MAHELTDIVKMMKVFHEVENALSAFLFQSSFAMKHKKSGAEKALKAIEEYKKLPQDIRKEIEKDKTTNISKIEELEKICKEAITKK